MGTMARKLLKGTLLLTITGFATRILGFFYRIYLADMLGAHYLGIYQLIFPVYAICFTIYGAGIQTALSQVIASEKNQNNNTCSVMKIFRTGTAIALLLAFGLQFFMWWKAEWIALHFVMEPALTPYLRIMAVFFPFCCLSACINGYYYGIQDAKIPAITQVIEQIFRIFFVFGMTFFMMPDATVEENCRIAVWGLAAGEISSCFFNVWKLWKHCRNGLKKRSFGERFRTGNVLKQGNRASAISLQTQDNCCSQGMRSLLWLASTLTLTRLFITFLNSVETVLLPAMLKRYGCSSEEALSIYGVLTGMTFSFLLFPSTITNSLAVLLVPSVAEADAAGDTRMIRRSISLSIRYCLLLGILCTGIFMVFGKELGLVIFHNELAGDLLVTLSWLCPFLYLGTALTSIINGMKKTHISFVITAVSLGVRILFLLWAVPVYGMRLYLIGLLVSQLLQVLLELLYLKPYLWAGNDAETGRTEEDFDAFRGIFVPGILLIPSAVAAKSSYRWLGSCFSDCYAILYLAAAGMVFCMIYLAGLLLTGGITLSFLRKRNPSAVPSRQR